jgi:hypothetical protein
MAAIAAISTVALLGGCATQPMGPTIPAMPPQGKSMDVFQQDENYCEQYAGDRASGHVKQADDNELRNGVIGAAIGAGIGALGSGPYPARLRHRLCAMHESARQRGRLQAASALPAGLRSASSATAFGLLNRSKTGCGKPSQPAFIRAP